MTMKLHYYQSRFLCSAGFPASGQSGHARNDNLHKHSIQGPVAWTVRVDRTPKFTISLYGINPDLA